jgi:hypothetical protein
VCYAKRQLGVDFERTYLELGKSTMQNSHADHAVKVTEHLAFHRLVLDSADANRAAWEEGATLMLRKKRIHETVSQMQAFKIKVCSAD